MELDKDLVRRILLAVEANDDDPRVPKIIQIEGYMETQVSYHVALMAEAGLLTAKDMGNLKKFTWGAQRLTYRGHEFLDAVRDPEIWRKTKSTAQKAGGAGISFLWEIAKAELRIRLGLP